MSKNMNKKLLFGLFVALFLILSINSVYAIDILDSILQPFRGSDVGRIYETYSLFIDAVLYLLLFLGLTQMIYVKVYGKKEGKLVAIAIGLALTFAMALIESNTGFRLGSLMPIGAIILMFALFILLYNLFNGVFNDAGASFALAFLIIYAFIMSTFSFLYRWLETNAPLLAALIQIAMVISFVVLIIKLIGMFKGGQDDSTNPSVVTTTPITEGRSSEKIPVTPETTPVISGTIDITSPTEGQHFNVGDNIRVAFNVSGTGFSKKYDYEVLLNGKRFNGVIHKVAGNQVFPVPMVAGKDAKTGTNVIQINALKRGLFGGTNKIFAQSAARNFIVEPGGGGGKSPGDLVDLITNTLDAAIIRLLDRYRQYASVFNKIIQMHHDAFRTKNPAAEPTTDEWTALITARDEMLRAAADVNTIITGIHSHPGYGTLTSIHLAVLATNITRNTRLRRAIIQYEIQARTDYNTNSAPRAPIIP